MGIKELWSILAPFGERKPLYELEGKKVAIDLSGWVCDSQNVTEYTIQPRLYLRNLYFRTCYLLLLDVHPIFVLDGRAPDLKHKTIAARNALQFRGARPKQPPSEGPLKPRKDRSRFGHTLRLCRDLLRLMGLACLQADGEAEAFCAHLDRRRLVEGVISQDSDCFAYGARKVYKNFSISTQGHQAAKGGSIDVYELEKASKTLRFGRNKIVALALLCGSDYGDGVHGIGKDSALKWFERMEDDEVLDRLRRWRTDAAFFEALAAKVAAGGACQRCGHAGSAARHAKGGCARCATQSGCGDGFKVERAEIRNELNMREKALKEEGFPNEEMIEEFLGDGCRVEGCDLNWSRPDVGEFIKFTLKYLEWEPAYSFEKFLPIQSRWQLLNPRIHPPPPLAPLKILKKRKPKGVPSYEIIWTNPTNEINVLIDAPIDPKLWHSIEPETLVQNAYPDLITAFDASKAKPKTKKKRTKVDQLCDSLNNVSISEPKPKRGRKLATIERFLVKHSSTPVKSVEKVNKKAENKQKVEWSFEIDLDRSCFGDENDPANVSGIIQRLTKLNKIGGNSAENRPITELCDNSSDNGLNSFLRREHELSFSFFSVVDEHNDIFEKTFNQMYCPDSDDEFNF